MMNKLLPLFFLLSACAPEEKDPKAPICVLDNEIYIILYPDGQTRKSRRLNCSDGCEIYYSVDDPNVTFKECQ